MKYEGTATSRRGQRESFKSKATPTSGAPFIRAAATSRYPKATAELLKAFGLSSLLVPEMRERRPKRHLFELLPPECVRNIAEKLFEGLGVSIGGHAAVTWPSRASYLSVLGVALLSREMALEVRRLAWRTIDCKQPLHEMKDGAAFFKSLKELTPTLGHHVVTLKATTRFSPSIIRELTSLRHLHIRLGAPATFTPFCKALAHLKPSIKTLYIDEAALVELGTTAGLTAEQGVLFGEAIATFLPLTDVTLGSIRDLPFLMHILHALGGLPGVRKVALRYCRSLRGSQALIPPSNADGSIRFPQLESFVHSNGSSTWTTLSAQLFQEGMAGPKLRSMDLENVYSVAGPPAAAVSKRRLRNLTRLALGRVRVTMSILEECRGGALKELTVGTTGTRDEDLRSLVPLVNLTHDLPHLTQLDLHLPHPRSAAFLRHIASNAVTAGTLARLEAQEEQLKAIMESRGGEMRLHRTGMSTIVPEDDETISDFEEPPAAVNESMDEVAT